MMNVKRMKWIAVMLIVGFLAAIPVMALAGEHMANDQSSITGKVQKTDQGIVISADDGATYMVQGKDLSDMVGKTVMATGTLAEGASGKTLTITSVEVAKE